MYVDRHAFNLWVKYCISVADVLNNGTMPHDDKSDHKQT